MAKKSRARREKIARDPGELRKSRNPTVLQRLREVVQIRLDGAEFDDVREYALGDPEADPPRKPWGISDGQLWRYIRAADDVIADSCELDRTKLVRHGLAQRRRLYARCVEIGDYGRALACLDSLARLADLFPAERRQHEHTGKDGHELKIVVEVIRAREDDPALHPPG